MKIVLFEDEQFKNLLPLAYFRPVWEYRCGAKTLVEKIASYSAQTPFVSARSYLMMHYLPENSHFSQLTPSEPVCWINGRWRWDQNYLPQLSELAEGQGLTHEEQLIAFMASPVSVQPFLNNGLLNTSQLMDTLSTQNHSAQLIRYPWDAINQNGEAIAQDVEHFATPGHFGKVDDGVHILNQDAVILAENSRIMPGVVIDAENGPVWIDHSVTVMPNSVLEGPLYIGPHSKIKIAAKIYENTSIGEWCKIGGEVEGTIIQSYSNKQHDGFLGHAYLGSWVNLGADTNNSDLKNNYGQVTVQLNGKPVNSGSQFVGLMMGDHSKTAINTMFNTGTVIGVNCNLFGAGMPPKFVPSFSWGGADRLQEYNFEKATSVAKTVMARRKVAFTENTRSLFAAVKQLSLDVEGE